MSTHTQNVTRITLETRNTLEPKGIPTLGAGSTTYALIYPNGAYREVGASDEYTRAKSKISRLVGVLDSGHAADARSRTVIEANILAAKADAKRELDRIYSYAGLVDTPTGPVVIPHWHVTKYGTYPAR